MIRVNQLPYIARLIMYVIKGVGYNYILYVLNIQKLLVFKE